MPDAPTILAPPTAPQAGAPASGPTLAERVAGDNLRRNAQALARTQPWLCLPAMPAGELVFARDGALAVVDSEGRFGHGCSIPRAAAEALLGKLRVDGPGACLPAPRVGEHVLQALRRMRPEQYLLAIVPDPGDFAAMLRCVDASDEIAAGRLWFAAGGSWMDAAERIYAERPGLALPGQFVRLSISRDSEVAPVMAAAQDLFARLAAARQARMAALAHSPRPTERSALIVPVVPSRFRPLDDSAELLRAALPGGADAIDPDDPSQACLLLLAERMRGAGAVVAAGMGRPNATLPTCPWITICGATVPSAAGAGADDRLVLPHPALHGRALAAGWDERRLALAAPVVARPAPPATLAAAIIADIPPLEAPEELGSYSSHRVLWRTLHEQALERPWSDEPPAQVLGTWLRDLSLDPSGVPLELFIERLIRPARQVGVARTLKRAGVPVRLYGAGWGAFGDLRERWVGEIRTRRDLLQAARDSTLVLDVHPDAHALARLGRPLVPTAAPDGPALVNRVARALVDPPPAADASGPALDERLLRSLLPS